MRKIRRPAPAKLFVGMLSSDTMRFDECTDLLVRTYGAVDMESDIAPWSHTDHYEREMGGNLLRKFIFFERLVDPGILAAVKAATNKIEERKAVTTPNSMKRSINLDPGYITEAKVVLASTKDYSHRIYIGQNIYAEVALRYNGKTRSFVPFEHTYPDFRSQKYRTLFKAAREVLRSPERGEKTWSSSGSPAPEGR